MTVTQKTSPAAQFRPVLQHALEHAHKHLDGLDTAFVAPTASKDVLRTRLDRPLGERGLDPTQVIDDLVADVAGGILGSTGGRFFGWVVGGSLPAALAADWLTSTWDQNAVLYASAPAEAVIEEVCGAWLKDLLRLPASASFSFVTGCQMAHVTCLAAARHRLLANLKWDVERGGLAGSPPIRVLSGARHGSIERAVRLLGLGSDTIVDLKLDDDGRLDRDALEDALATDASTPTIVLLQAGDINTGAFDNFRTLIPLAQRHGAWVHIDGAFGLWANASPTHRYLLTGVEAANSWATDGHKWLNVPYDSGYAFVADTTAHRNSMSHHATYLTHDDDARDPMDWTPEWSRRGRGVATYAALRQLGRDGVTDLIDRSCQHARNLASRIAALPGAELLREAEINQALVRFPDPRAGATRKDHDAHTDQVIAAIQRSGEAFFSGTESRGQRCMRISACNWQTSDADVERAVSATRRALEDTRP